jgi:Alginate export
MMILPLALVFSLAQAPAAKAPTAPTPPVPAQVESFADLFRQGKIARDFRLRYEHVDDAAFTQNADAFTLRSRAGFRTAAMSNWSAYAEIESVYALREDYNSTANRRTQFPIIADPEGTEFNQVYLAYGFNTSTQAILGRQRINYDNQRFFGSVNFRQNEQTFDALTFNHAQNGYAIKLAYLDEAHRIFGNSNPNQLLRQLDLSAILVNASHQFQPSAGPAFAGNTLSAYSYFVENESQPLSSSKTLGLRYAAGMPFGERKRFFYNLEYAKQSDYQGGSALIDADYSLAELGLSFDGGRYTFKAAQETLGGDGRNAFQTPFATLHAFNGWADRFLITPNIGLRDRYLDAAAKFGPGILSANFHRFDSDIAQSKLGSEIGVQYFYQFDDRINVTLKGANYRADSFSKDVVKTWFFVDYKY